MAAEPKASAAISAFDRFVVSTSPVCQSQASRQCVESAWRFADSNRDQVLSSAELQAMQSALRDWSSWKGARLKPQERNAIALGMWIADSIGLKQLIASYDQDGDQAISRSELLADVTLDRRPLGQVLRDPEAVDRAAMAQRLGALAPLLDPLFR